MVCYRPMSGQFLNRARWDDLFAQTEGYPNFTIATEASAIEDGDEVTEVPPGQDCFILPPSTDGWVDVLVRGEYLNEELVKQIIATVLECRPEEVELNLQLPSTASI